jgi:hypothetical protein
MDQKIKQIGSRGQEQKEEVRDHPEIYERWFEDETKLYTSKWNKSSRKKRRKKYKKLRKETISLKEYEGTSVINREYVLKRR